MFLILRYILIAIFSFHSTVGFTLTTMIFRFGYRMGTILKIEKKVFMDKYFPEDFPNQ